MNEWVNQACSLSIDYINHIINYVSFYIIKLCIWFIIFYIAYHVLNLCWWLTMKVKRKSILIVALTYTNVALDIWIHIALNERTAAPAAHSCTSRSGTAAAACSRPKILPTVSTGDRRVAMAVFHLMPYRRLAWSTRLKDPSLRGAAHGLTLH